MPRVHAIAGSGMTGAHVTIIHGIRMGFQLEKFGYGAAEISMLEVALSPERFRGYVLRSGGDRAKAVRLYERNTYLSEALYGILQGLEVALRNGMHREISTSLGQYWYTSPVLQHPQSKMVQGILNQLIKDKRPQTPGRVVSELSFGFWTGLLGPKYEKALWVKCLYKLFKNATYQVLSSMGTVAHPLTRSDVARELNSIRTLRNQIAHHERIIDRDLAKDYESIITTAKWICPKTASWISATNCFYERWVRPF